MDKMKWKQPMDGIAPRTDVPMCLRADKDPTSDPQRHGPATVDPCRGKIVNSQSPGPGVEIPKVFNK